MNNISNRSAAPLVLIADDLLDVIRGYQVELESFGIRVVTATTLEELDEVFDHHEHELAAVILDGCIPGHRVNTDWFISRARKRGFEKPIVAASSSPEYRDFMMQVGCSHQAPKWSAVELVADLLSTP